MKTERSDDEIREEGYVSGGRVAWARMLQMCIRELDYEGRTLESLVVEREAAVAALRSLCAEHGDNDWPDDLHLGDIIDKHLGDYLEA